MRLALASTGAALALVLAPSGTAAGHRCLVVTEAGEQPFVRNFNPFTNPVDLTLGGIYEPLVVVTSAAGGHRYDWLASGLRWSADRRTLTLQVRRGVRWSDGEPLTSADVVYSLTAGRRERALDRIGLTRRGNEVVSVRATGRYAVAIRLARVDTTFVSSELANAVVVPAHVFARRRDVAGWTNPDPVGTGPFAVVERFGEQGYALGRNPRYWRRGAPHFACVEHVLSSSSESALLQMRSGEIDLTNNFIPNVQKAYVSHDPADFHYFYPSDAAATGLFFDDTVYPFSLVALRKAISLAIDRKRLSAFGEYHYAPAVGALGIDEAWPGWIAPSVAAQARALARHDPARARTLLRAAGFTYRGSKLRDPRGDPVVLEASVIASWIDWYTDWRLIKADLDAIGIDVHLEAVPEWGAWFRVAASTKKATLMWSTAGDTDTPYDYFKEHLDASSFVPSGASALDTGDWEHFRSAAATRLLARFRRTGDVAVQHRLAERLERIWLAELPFVPLFAGPTWSTYSTRYFVGFPSARDEYVGPDFTNVAYVVALTRIRPR